MKSIYLLKTIMMNGTVTMLTQSSAFETLELAEKTKKEVDEANNKEDHDGYYIYSKIEKIQLYSDESEVPILQKEGKVEK